MNEVGSKDDLDGRLGGKRFLLTRDSGKRRKDMGSLTVLRNLRTELELLQNDMPWVKGLAYFGSRTIASEKPFTDNDPSDVDLYVFEDHEEFDARKPNKPLDTKDKDWYWYFRSATDELIKLHKKKYGQKLEIMKPRNGKSPAFLEVDISKRSTDLLFEHFVKMCDTNGPIPEKMIIRFLLSVGKPIYENRAYIFSKIEKLDNPDFYVSALINGLQDYERLKKREHAVPYEHFPRTLEEARKYFLNIPNDENALEPIFKSIPLALYETDVEGNVSDLSEAQKDITIKDDSPFAELRELAVSSRSFPSEGDFEIITNLKTLEFTTSEMVQECASHIIEIAHKLEAFEVVAVTGKSRGFTLDLLTSAGLDQSKIVQLNSEMNSQMYKWDSELTIEQKRELLLREINEQIPGIDFVRSICVAEDQIASGEKASSYLRIFGGIDGLENFGYSSFVNPRAITQANNEELVKKFGEANVQSFSRLIYPENSSNGVDGIVHILSRVCSRMDDENLLRDVMYTEPTKELVKRLVSGIIVRIKSEIVRQKAQMTTDATAVG